MRKAFLKHIEENLTFIKDKKLLVACSGGLDSTVLCHLLKINGFNFALAHCNFSLRGNESDKDENFVTDLAETFETSVFTETFDTERYAEDQKISTQMAARLLRYKWFDEILSNFKYDYILTAHHADDSLETFIINLSRASGLKGLTGIPEKNGTVIRPLLAFSRVEILKYATENKIKWREDATNAQTKYLRNKIRHDVIPPLKKISDNFLENFKQSQSHLEKSANLVDDYIQLVFKNVVTETETGYSISISKLIKFPNFQELSYELLSPFGFSDFNAISNLLQAQSGKQILSKTHRLLKNRNEILITIISDNKTAKSYTIHSNQDKINDPIKMHFESVKIVEIVLKNTIYVDADKVTYPLVLRTWNEGDVFQPFGMKGKKKLSKFFKDEKLSLVVKEKQWILCSDKKIIWIVGLRADNRFKVTESTINILKITI